MSVVEKDRLSPQRATQRDHGVEPGLPASPGKGHRRSVTRSTIARGGGAGMTEGVGSENEEKTDRRLKCYMIPLFTETSK